MESIVKVNEKMKTSVIFHLPFNPADPPSFKIQEIFKKTMLATTTNNTPPLPNIQDSQMAPMGINKMIIAYSKQKSLRNILFPRKFDQTSGPNCLHYLNSSNFKHLFNKK